MAYTISAEYCTPKDVSDFLGLSPSDNYDLNADSGVSETNPDRLYIGTNYVPLFNIGDQVRVWDQTNQIGEDHVVKSIGSNYLVLTSNLVGNYEVVDHARFRILSAFHNRSNPTYDEVENLILMIQDTMDERMRNSFLSKGRRREEWYNFMPHFRRRFPAFNVLPFTPPDTFWWIRLQYSPTMKFSDDDGDFIKLNMGGSWVNLLDPNSGYTEWDPTKTTARTADSFWVDYVNGFIFMTTIRPAYTPYAAYIGYRFGETEYRFSSVTSIKTTNYVPYDIKRACILMVCSDILGRERYAMNAPGGELAGNIDVEVQLGIWSREVDRVLARHTNMLMMGGGD